MFLPDINIWLALAFERHLHHSRATNWFESLSEFACSFCRITQQGFLRLATNPKVFADDALTLVDAWKKYDALLGDPRVAFAEEPAGLEQYWRLYTKRRTFSPNVWGDAYLAAFARASAMQVATFDRGFVAYKKLKCVLLS